MWIVWLVGVVWGASSPCAPGIDEYRHEVVITSSGYARTNDTYRFSVPSAKCKNIELPRRLDGTVLDNSDLEVRDGHLVRKSQWQEGDVLVVHGTSDLGKGPHSAEVLRPGFPVGTMSVQITAPSYARLNVWAAPHGRVSVDAARTKTYRAVFSGGGRLVWSSEKDWWAVGERLRRVVNAKLANKWSLGELGEGVDSLTVADVLSRVSKEIKLDPLGPDWRKASVATTVMRKKHGSAAERALVMLSLLRAANYDANPVLVRTVDAAKIPLVVPGYALFTRIAIRVRQEGRPDIWLDPGSANAQTDSMPRALRGAIVLEPGDQPRTLYDRMVPDGRITIRSTAKMRENGTFEITAEVTAEDGANQAVRDVLAPLPKNTRKQWLSDLLRVVRPGIEDLRFQVFGVEDPDYPFGMSMEFDTEEELRQLGSGLAGQVPAVLAPQLARVLPPNIEVVEELSVEGIETLELYGIRPVEDPVDAEVILHRSMKMNGKTAVLKTLALRPWRASDREQATSKILDEASLKGPELVFFGVLDRAAARALQKEVTNSETRVMEALLWYHADEPEEAEKALRRAIRTGRVRNVADALRRYAERGDRRPWDVIWEAVSSDDERLVIVDALEGRNELREAWRRASMLLSSDDPLVQIQALVAVARVQGEKPAANIDEAGHKAWRDPTLLLSRAEKLAAVHTPNSGDATIDVDLAARFLERGLCDEAGPRVARAAKISRGPRTLAVLENWRVCAGLESEQTELESLILESDFDPLVMRSAVSIWSARGQPHQARRWAVLAALLEQEDEVMWREAMEASLLAGDLPTAVYSARHASDLRPGSMTSGVPLQLLATLAGDQENADLATQRSGYQVSIEPFPISMENAAEFIKDEQRLGFLRVRDAEVLADPELLHERFQRNLKAGNHLESARDAAWLAKVHRKPEALLDVYRSSSTTLWSTHPLEPLVVALRNRDVRRLRMESALLTGASDPISDTGYLRGDAVAELLRDTRYKSHTLAERVGWPKGLSNPKVKAPAGYRSSRLLGALKGVVGFTNAAAGSVLLVSSAGEEFPPPLQGAFRLGEVIASESRVTIYRLEGGLADGYVAKRSLGELTYWGAARTIQLARHALESGITAQSVQ